MTTEERRYALFLSPDEVITLLLSLRVANRAVQERTGLQSNDLTKFLNRVETFARGVRDFEAGISDAKPS